MENLLKLFVFIKTIAIMSFNNDKSLNKYVTSVKWCFLTHRKCLCSEKNCCFFTSIHIQVVQLVLNEGRYKTEDLEDEHEQGRNIYHHVAVNGDALSLQKKLLTLLTDHWLSISILANNGHIFGRRSWNGVNLDMFWLSTKH